MNEQYRGFNLYGGSEPISETAARPGLLNGNQRDASLTSTAME